jgi:hypothetical protein
MRRDLERVRRQTESMPHATVPGMPAVSAELGGSTTPMPAVDAGAMMDGQDARIRALEEELAKLGAELAAGDVGAFKQRAEEAYAGVNDALSELRTEILRARELAGNARPLSEAIQLALDRAEDAKGVLRQLRELL